MNQRVLLAALAGAVVCFGVGFVVYGILLDGFYRSELIAWSSVMKDQNSMGAMEFILIFLSNICWSLLLALIFSKWAGIRSLKDGMMAGFWLSLIIGAAFDLYMMAAYNGYGAKLLVVDVLLSGVMGAIAGGTVGVVLGMGEKKA